MTGETEDDLEEDAEFQRLLVRCLELTQRGGSVDREQLRSEHPEYAESICQFLDNQDAFQGVFGRRAVDADAFDDQATLYSGDPTETSSGSVWSFARLGEANFPVSFGDYSLLEEIDRGGMGIVFKARHEQLNRIVALKILRAGELSNEDELARFRAEAEASASINHPNIISIYEVGEFSGLVYFTMAFIEGRDLGKLIQARTLDPKEAARIVSSVAHAVDAAHRGGIIHRDLKPSNILLDARREPYLIDFGLAKTGNTVALTCTGQILGTPAYMSPEQARGDILTPASDVYSLGAVLYEAIAGQPPFTGPTPIDVLLQVLNREPATPRKLNNKVPRALEMIILRAMEKSPQGRYESAADLQSDLQRFILDEPIERPRPTVWERAETWWRREPVLVSHLCGTLAVLLIVVGALVVRGVQSPNAPWIVTLLAVWAGASIVLQRLSVIRRYQEIVQWGWAAFDVIIFTTLIYIAAPPRGLLLVGYPMMIAASGLFYRTRFVVFVTTMCILGFCFLCATVDDSLTERPEFGIIYISGLVVLGSCLISMIRRIRGFADYFARER